MTMSNNGERTSTVRQLRKWVVTKRGSHLYHNNNFFNTLVVEGLPQPSGVFGDPFGNNSDVWRLSFGL